MSISEWADDRRELSSGDAKPGKWRTSEMEPMRAVMDAGSDPEVREVVVKKGTQIGYTEALLNTVGYHIDLDPCPILWLLPDQKAVDEISKNRLDPMLEATPKLKGKVKPKRARDSGNTISGKQFPGGRIAIVGSHAPNDISSRPIRLVICDETDRMALSAGVDGDPMSLAAKRQTWFWNRKTIKGSSPTTKDRSVIDREYRLSDMRECWVGCVHCGEKQVLRWSNVRWDSHLSDDGKTKVHQPETAHYQCEHCGELWDDDDRFLALSRVTKADWKPTAAFNGIAGFHFPQFLSTKVNLQEMVKEFLVAFGKMPNTYPDVQKMKVWTNTVLAECWEEQGETVDVGALSSRGELYGPDDLPEQCLFATVGVDTQGDRLEAQFIAWGPGEESWPFLYVVLQGDPAQLTVWNELDVLLREQFSTVSGRSIRVKAGCVDAGGHHAAQVHAFCKDKVYRRIFPIVGQSGPKMIWPVRRSRSKHGTVFTIGVDTGKDAIYGRLKLRPKPDPDQPNPGFIHFPIASEESRTEGFTSEYFEQLTVEKVVTRYREGKPYRVWEKKPAERNEALDTFVYAVAARHSLTHLKLAPMPEKSSDASCNPPPSSSTDDSSGGAPESNQNIREEQAVLLRKSRSRTQRLTPADVGRMFR